MESIFSLCHSIKNLDLSSFNTQKVYTMSYMFYECESLTNLNISNFNTKEASVIMIFSGCKSLKYLKLSSLIKLNCEKIFHEFKLLQLMGYN